MGLWRARAVSLPCLPIQAHTLYLLCSLQLGANALLFVGVNMYGVFVRIVTERSQRKAFLQARGCIEDRLRLEDENEKQVRARGAADGQLRWLS